MRNLCILISCLEVSLKIIIEDGMYALIAHLRKIPPLLLSLIISSRWPSLILSKKIV